MTGRWRSATLGAPGRDHIHPPIGREAARCQGLGVIVKMVQLEGRWTALQEQVPRPPIKLK
jgi:hypothetical protein